MSAITIRQQDKTENGFKILLNFPNGASYPLTLTNPFTPTQEQNLEWYFEGRWRNPNADPVKAQEIARSLKHYGINLFEQIFKTNDVPQLEGFTENFKASALASTYHQLGRVAQELREWEEAKNYYLEALGLWQEFRDSHSIMTYTQPWLQQLYEQTQDETILETLKDLEQQK